MYRSVNCRAILGASVLSILIAGSAHAATYSTLTGEAPVVIAHRGASGYLPEHTLAAYELAAKMGADFIEPDVQITSDGELVAIHDDTLTRTTNVEAMFAPRNGGYAVSDFTLAEIKSLTVDIAPLSSAHSDFVPSYSTGSTVPTLAEVFSFVNTYNADHGTDIGVYPEAKAASTVLNQKIVQELKAHGYTSANDKAYIQSFSLSALADIANYQTAAGTDIDLISLTYAVGTGIYDAETFSLITLESLVGLVDGVGVYIGTGANAVTQPFVDLAHSLGLQVHLWTFGTLDEALALEQLNHYLDMGVDGVFANFPDYAVTAVDGLNPSPVPVPAAAGLMLTALGGLGLARLRRRAA